MNSNRYQFILSTIAQAGELLLQKRDEDFSIRTKDGDRRNLVTSVDVEIDLFIKKSIQDKFAGDRIYSEESVKGDPAQSDSFWTIDPIDGTSNFARGIPHFAISCGFIEKGICLVGAVYNPVTRDLFSFEKGKGAFLNGKPIKASETKTLRDAYVSLHIGRPESLREWGLDLQRKFLGLAKKTINFGSSALDLCFVANGRVDLTIYGTLTTLDCAPAIGILREAGGEVYDYFGKPITLQKSPQKIVASCSKALFDQAITLG